LESSTKAQRILWPRKLSNAERITRLSRAMARGVEELIGDVAQDGGAARGDAALGDQG